MLPASICPPEAIEQLLLLLLPLLHLTFAGRLLTNLQVRSAISGRLAIHTALEEQLQEDWVDIMTAEAPASFERVIFDWPEDWWQVH